MMSYSVIRHYRHNSVRLWQLHYGRGDMLGSDLPGTVVRVASTQRPNKSSSFTDRLTSHSQKTKLKSVLEALSVESKSDIPNRDAEADAEAEELKVAGIPPIIRCAIPTLFFNKTYSYTGRYHRFPHESCSEVESLPVASRTYNDFCLQLGIPMDAAIGFSSVKTVLKLHELNEKKDTVLKYTDHKDAMDELFQLLLKQVNLIDNSSLPKIMCYMFSVDFFPLHVAGKIISKFMLFMNEDKYSVPELLDFLESLKVLQQLGMTPQKRSQLIRVEHGIWNHFSIRPHKISPGLLAEMYSQAPSEHSFIFKVLQDLLMDDIDQLHADDIAVILKATINKLPDSSVEQDLVITWLSEYGQNLSVGNLESLFSAFLCDTSVNNQLLQLLPKLFSGSNIAGNMTSRLVSLLLTLCERGRFFDEHILETCCEHYVKNGEHYLADELAVFLRTLGLMCYTPTRDREFFSKVEQYLHENFYMIDVLMVLEMFVHLIYVDRIPYNFMQYVFAPLFLGLVNEMPPAERTKAATYLCVMEDAFRSRGAKPLRTLPIDRSELLQEVDNTSNADVLPALTDVFGDKVLITERERPSFSSMFLEMILPEVAKAIDFTDLPDMDSKELALLVLPETSYTQNTHQLLGFEHFNISQLQNRGLTVVTVNQIHVQRLMKQNRLSPFLYLLLEQTLDSLVDKEADKTEAAPVVDTEKLKSADLPERSDIGDIEEPHEDSSEERDEDDLMEDEETVLTDDDSPQNVLSGIDTEQKR